MLAARIHQYGGPEVIQIDEVLDPAPTANEVLVKIDSAGVNFLDIYYRQGLRKSTLPFMLGNEGAGTVAKVGEGVSELKIGDRVAFLYGAPSYAEFAVLPADRIVKLPNDIDTKIAAAALLQGTTAHYLTRDTFALKKGDWCLVHAAAGGTGMLIVQMARQIGAHVIGVVSNEAKMRLAFEAGADHVLISSVHDFVDQVQGVSGGGVHVAYDGVGRATFQNSLQCLRPLGYLALFGQASGAVPSFDLSELSAKSLFVTRPSLPNYIADAATLRKRATDVWDAIENGTLRIQIAAEFPLFETRRAHELLESRKATGKVLLTLN